MLPDDEGVAALGTIVVFGTIGADAEDTSVFVAGAGDVGSTGDTALAGTVSTGLTSLAALPPAVLIVEDAVAATTGIGGGVVASTVGGFADATDATGDGHR
jgi:hypothetical protein